MRRLGFTACFLLVISVFLNGCTTAWQESGTFERTIQTELFVESTPQSRVQVNKVARGETPMTMMLEYHQTIQKKTRKVSYWITKPDVALWVTLLSLGVYLPMSVIPVDIETRLEPMAVYSGNEFHLRAVRDGYDDWVEVIRTLGEPKLLRRLVLTPVHAP
jgi:hypothetical protein